MLSLSPLQAPPSIALMRKKPLYNFGQLIFLGGMCSASICSVSFSGSFIDWPGLFPSWCAPRHHPTSAYATSCIEHV